MSGQLKTACVQGMNHTDLYNEWIRKQLTCPRLQLVYSTNPRTGKSVTAIPNTQIHRQTKNITSFTGTKSRIFQVALFVMAPQNAAGPISALRYSRHQQLLWKQAAQVAQHHTSVCTTAHCLVQCSRCSPLHPQHPITDTSPASRNDTRNDTRWQAAPYVFLVGFWCWRRRKRYPLDAGRTRSGGRSSPDCWGGRNSTGYSCSPGNGTPHRGSSHQGPPGRRRRRGRPNTAPPARRGERL